MKIAAHLDADVMAKVAAETAARILRDGTYFAAGGGNGLITIWQPDETWRLAHPKNESELELNFIHGGTQVEDLLDETVSSDSQVQENWRVQHVDSGISVVSGCTTSVGRYEPCPEGYVQAYRSDGSLIDLQPVKLVGWPRSLMLNSDGTMLAASACPSGPEYDCSSSEIWVWSLLDGQVKKWVTSITRVTHLVFSPDGRYLAYGGEEGKEAMLFDLNNDRETRLPLLILPGEFTGLAFSPDGSRLAVSASYQDPGLYMNTIQHSTILIWDTNSGQVIAHANLPGSTTSDLAFSEDGNLLEYFIVEGYEYPFNVWTLGLEQWQEIACQIANRNLTEAEWQRYVIGEEYRQVCP